MLLGPAVHFTDPQASDALAENSDFLWYDIEHHAMSIEALRNHLMVARNRGIPGIVRVSASDTEFYKTILDVGASGVVVPQVYWAEETRRVVGVGGGLFCAAEPPKYSRRLYMGVW